MTDREFMQKVLDILPGAQVGDDNYGQVIIYTNLKYNSAGELVETTDADFEEATSSG